MKLDVKERLLLLNILPKETNFLIMKIARDLQDNLGFSEAELKELKFVTNEDGLLKWDPKAKIEEKEIEIGEKANEMIVSELKKLDEQKKLRTEHYEFYAKFLEA